jgi:delta1-piperideine-2-carboxylate reductase
MTDRVRVPQGDLVRVLTRIFLAHRCSAQVAAMLAQNMALAEADGAHSHGVFRVAGNLGSLDSGWVDGKAVPIVEDVAPGMVRVDGNNGFAQPALLAARDLFVGKARTNGIALLSVRNAHHFGALWPDIEPLARDGLLALMMVNSMASVVPHGGSKKLYGTNPLGFAVPRPGADPLVFDQASSAWSNGDVQIARREGRALPPGVGIDRHGKPTTDPDAVLSGGALLPFGGHKGSSIAMMMEAPADATTPAGVESSQPSAPDNAALNLAVPAPAATAPAAPTPALSTGLPTPADAATQPAPATSTTQPAPANGASQPAPASGTTGQ